MRHVWVFGWNDPVANFISQYTFKYTPLSPVHIGSGDSYEPTNYVIDQGVLYEFDYGGPLMSLTPEDRQELLQITEGVSDKRMLQALQRFYYDRRDDLKSWAINKVPVLEGVSLLYEDWIGKSIHQGNGRKQKVKKLEIERTAYNPISREPVLFGSSVKGAIRTALLNEMNDGGALPKVDAGWFKVDGRDKWERRRFEKEQKKLYQRLNQRLFKFQAGHFELDPMRLLQVGDAVWSCRNSSPKVQVFVTVNRKKKKVINQHGVERLSQAEKNENLCKLLECVSPWRYRAFVGSFNIQRVNEIPAQEHIKLPNANLRFSMDQVAKICCGFYLPILKAEMALMKERGFIDHGWYENMQALLQALDERMAKGDVFLLRVGRHSGAETVTLDGVRNIKIMKGNPEYQDRTKTLWLAAKEFKQRTALLPFGWVLVEVEKDGKMDGDWLELAGLCNHHMMSPEDSAV